MTYMPIHAVKEWYKGDVPNFRSNEFARFAAGSISFLRYVTGKDTSIRIDDSCQSAYASADHSYVFIPAATFNADFIETLHPGFTVSHNREYIAIGLFNGLLLHEAYHVMYSYKTKPDFFTHEQLHGRHNELLFILANIVEDLYIEARARLNRAHAPWIDIAGEVYFGDTGMEMAVKQVEDRKDRKLRNPNDWINLLIASKLPRNRSHRIWGKWPEALEVINAIVESAAVAGNRKEQRTDWAIELYEMFDIETLDGDASGKIFVPGKGEPTEGGDDEVAKFHEDLESEADGLGDREDEAAGETMERLREVMREFGDELKRIAADEDRNKDYDHLKTNVRQCDASGHALDYDAKKWAAFGRYLRAINTTNDAPTEASNKGKLHGPRLSRIATDGKIFRRRNNTRVTEPAEVQLLVDASGSMSGLYYKCLAAASGLLVSLRHAGIKVAVFTHTSIYIEAKHQCCVWEVCDTGVKTVTPKPLERIGTVSRISKLQNYDGLAINYVAKQFSKRRNQKVLIVLSDGEPHSGDYAGMKAMNHTKAAVEDARKNGITVFALSLVKGVLKSNDKIYGESWNIDATENIETQLQKIAEKIR